MSRIPTTSTLIPQLPIFLDALPSPPQPHPKPLAPLGRAPKRINDYRDLFQELEDLSEEETERNEIKNRGVSWLVPLGRQQTLQEEKNDASLSPSEAGSVSNGPPSNGDDNENDSVQDLDASMLDLDEVDAEPEEDEGITMTDDQDVSVNNLSLAEE
ncbi:hypothetical protein Clacol_006757 [Clathrus columnatus]|uniref:Uncharacterized protein n=1 Tax=Clathrus columnatus TaxID=1419009 RepID=A0AAV5AH79_9AGAM|nr:hypothetical protein Clacol_006757 [Clathrus columnatus]